MPLTPYGVAPSLPEVLPPRPEAGPVEILRSADVRPGMRGIAWTVFQGDTPEPVPVEILGLWKNAWGPKQDIILAKLGGLAAKTNVAGGMSGSPVYVNGKLVGAVALRISVFSPDAICGITPIEQMLEINSIDESKPSNARTPSQQAPLAELTLPNNLRDAGLRMVPIETPLAFAGFHEQTLKDFQSYFDQMGVTAVQGGAAGSLTSSTPAAGWKQALQPGQAIAGVLVSGDMSITGLGTVTYNDGKRVLGFGHSFFNLGPIDMPMSAGEVVMVLSSQFQPNKFANATQVVGALRQDRHSGIMGELGETSPTIPVTLRIRTQPLPGAATVDRTFHLNVFSHQKWTPFLMMMTAANALQDLNSTASDEATYRISGRVELEGMAPVQTSTLASAGDAPMPAPLQISAWWAEKFNRLYQNPQEAPKFKSVDLLIEMNPERRTAAIDAAWLDHTEVAPGGELTGQVVLQPWRGERMVRPFRIKVPENFPRGDHQLLVSDSDTLNRAQMIAGFTNRSLDLAQIVSLINQERPNDRLYFSLVLHRPTVYAEEQVLSGVPSSVLNVLQSGPRSRPLVATADTARLMESIPMNQIVAGSASLRFTVR
jgi:hypothetical protein